MSKINYNSCCYVPEEKYFVLLYLNFQRQTEGNEILNSKNQAQSAGFLFKRTVIKSSNIYFKFKFKLVYVVKIDAPCILEPNPQFIPLVI